MSQKLFFCIVCKSKEIHCKYKDKEQTSNKVYTYWSCANCGVLFINPMPTQNYLAGVYNTQENTIERKTNSLLFFFFDKLPVRWLFHNFAIRANRERADYVEKFFKGTSRGVFDFGCGVGRFLEEMAKRGWKVKGQDLSRECIAQASTRILPYGRSEFVSSLPENTKISNDTEVITMWHVLEHLPNFNQVIKNLSQQMKTGAGVVIECPNAQALSIKLFGVYSPTFITPEHLTFWSEKGYRTLLETHGFEVVDISFSKTFIFTSASAAYKYFYGKVWLGAFPIALVVLVFSVFIYFFINKYNESIRVAAIKQ